MLNLMRHFQLTKVNGAYLSGTITLLEHTSSMVKIFRDMRPIRCSTDSRLDQLSSALAWFVEWEKHIANDPSSTANEKKKKLPSHESLFDLKSCLIGFKQIVALTLKENSRVQIVPGKLNSDIIENNFCQ